MAAQLKAVKIVMSWRREKTAESEDALCRLVISFFFSEDHVTPGFVAAGEFSVQPIIRLLSRLS